MKFRLLALLAACLPALPLQAAEFTPLDRGAARSLLDPAQHRQPAVITLWSSDCSHCKKNLQLLATLAKSHPKLRVVTIAAEPESPVLGPMLARFSLPGPRYAYGSDNPEAIAYAIDPSWAGELPRSYLFDGHGGKEKFSGVLDEATVRRKLALPQP